MNEKILPLKMILHTKYQSPKIAFTASLLRWNAEANLRKMPWKGEKDPYKIWLSEIILQQTRVEQGWRYFEAFVNAFPTIHDLAAAPAQEVFKLWEGLGYYSRCRNLMAAAKQVCDLYGGIFPADYNLLLQLKGVGPYTAAAIASFAFNLPKAVVDGNVIRVLARYFGLDTPFDTTLGRRMFDEKANELIDKLTPSHYNQAIMDFGAIVCKPNLPLCGECPLQPGCVAYHSGNINNWPVRSKKITKKTRHFVVLVIKENQKTWVIKRTNKDVWQDLHFYYSVETGDAALWDENKVVHFLEEMLGIYHQPVKFVTLVNQQLTHQTIHGYFFEVQLTAPSAILAETGKWVSDAEFNTLAFPVIVHSYLKIATANSR